MSLGRVGAQVPGSYVEQTIVVFVELVLPTHWTELAGQAFVAYNDIQIAIAIQVAKCDVTSRLRDLSCSTEYVAHH